jgi:alpha-tubulin suppressor-like RCC1 family protein
MSGPAALALIAALALASAGCDGSTLTPDVPEGGFVAITVGMDHSCALAADGSAWCWGAAEWGQVGTGARDDEHLATQVGGPLRFAQLDAGALHTCGIDLGGLTHCWGVNNWGQLGDGTTYTFGTPIQSIPNLRFASVSGGWLHTCAATAQGDAYCWGANGQYQLGSANQNDQLVPRRVETSVRLTRVSAGGAHTCGLTPTGEAYCWGSNTLGQLGDGTTQDRGVPQPVVGGHRFSSISAGYTHTCGITVEGGYGFCWGGGEFGELGISALAMRGIAGVREPHPVYQGHPYIRISAGYYTSCGVSAGGRTWCWGLGQHGQLGTGSTRLALNPQPLTYRDRSDLLLTDINVGVTHTCGTAVTGVAWCWGTGVRGQLGVGGGTFSAWAVRVARKQGA